FGQNRQNGGCNDGTTQTADTTQNHKDQNQNGSVVIEFFGNQRRIVQRIQHTCNAGKYGSGDKCHQLVFGNRNAHRTRSNLIIADGGNCAAGTGVYKVQNHQQGNDHQDDTDGKGGSFGNTRDTLCTIDKELAVLHVQRAGVLQRKMQAIGIYAQIAGIHNVFDDFAKGQGNNCKIVTGKAQNRHANQKTKRAGYQTTNHKRQQQSQRFGGGRTDRNPNQCAGESSDAHKSGMAQAKFTQNTNSQVQGDCQNYIGTDGNQLARKRVAQHIRSRKQLDDNVKCDHNS